jgi:hypothetical protein
VEDADLPEEGISVLLPLIDLPNHRPLAKVEWRAGEEDVGMIILEDASPGQEISNNYGPRNNEQCTKLPVNLCDAAVSANADSAHELWIHYHQQSN